MIKLKHIASSTVPEYIREEYPLFLAFLNAYHDWLEANQVNIKTVIDLDTTLDTFVKHYKAEIDHTNSSFKHIDERFLLRHIKNFYLSKGTPESFSTLFKMMFNKDITLKYPGNQTLKPSDGKWEQIVSIFVEVQAGDALDLQKKVITVENITTNRLLDVTVNKVELRRAATEFKKAIYECNIDVGYYGTIEIGDEVTFGTFKGNILPTINSYSIISTGSNFRLGQTFEIDTTFGSGSLVKVTKLTNTKGIKELKFIRFGFGYVSDFESNNLIPPDTSQSTLSDGFVGFEGSVSDSLYPDPSGGYVLGETFSSEGYAYDYAGNVVREFYSYNKYKGNPDNGSIVKFLLGAVCKYPGHYANSDGKLSDESKLQDSRFYQKYSYVIQVDEKLESYKEAVKTFVHPAGTAMFGEYSIRNNIDITLNLTALFSVFGVKHADAALFEDSEVRNYEKVVNWTSNNHAALPYDRTTFFSQEYDVLIWHFDMEPIQDSTGSTIDTDTFLKVQAVNDSSNTILGEISDFVMDWNLGNDNVSPNTIPDYAGIEMLGDGKQLFETIRPDLTPIIINKYYTASATEEIVSASDAGTVILNLYVDPLANLISGNYISAPDATF